MYRPIASKRLLYTTRLTKLRPLTNRRSFTFTTPVYNSGPDTSKIYALPFKLSPEKAPQVVDLANYITEHKFLGFFRLLKSMLLKTLPQVSNTSHIQIRKAYLPFWYYDMAIKATVTRENDDGPERELLAVGLNNYWTGHTWDPMCYLSFGFPLTVDASTLQPFSTIIDNNNDDDDEEDIDIIPFTTDPFQDLAPQVSSALEGVQVRQTGQVFDISKAELVFGAAYPLYFPVYIAQVESDKDTVIVVGGQSDNPVVFKYHPEKKSKTTKATDNDEEMTTPASTTTKHWLNNGEWIRLDVTDPSWRVGLPVSPLQELCKKFMDKVVNKQDGSTLATTARKPIAWDDVRIQAYPTYQQGNKDYVQQLYKVWAQQGMLTRLDNVSGNQRTLGMGKNGLEMKSADQFKEEILNSVGDDLQKLEQVEPQWLKEYNHQAIQEKNNED
ncbi:hypothetical protein BCR42DRAFT_355108 [Absidia repens]|uniref:Uncharacterized protein n=1 Tax=Absidia repens TaxID=90262 RepID=A0A1X2ICJ1_9FUNG|nr:hypothetical protein BCR42DRAFT_355108 [Absidia repens]